MHIQHSTLGLHFDCPTSSTFDLNEWTDELDAMHQLELGSIANPTEGRQVGHYWLRNPSLAPEGMADVIRQSHRALRALDELIQQRNFDTLLMVGIGGSALG